MPLQDDLLLVSPLKVFILPKVPSVPPPISSQLCALHPISPRRILFYPVEGSEDNPSVPLAQRPAPCPAQGRLHPAGERVACVWPGEEEQLQFQPSRQHPKLYMYILN